MSELKELELMQTTGRIENSVLIEAIRRRVVKKDRRKERTGHAWSPARCLFLESGLENGGGTRRDGTIKEDKKAFNERWSR